MARVLVVGPHPDDQELGMGATIARLAKQGHEVLLLDMTDGEPTPMGDPATRAAEAKEAARILDGGTGKVSRLCLGLPNRFVEHTLEARHRTAGVMRAHQAEIVFLPFEEDAHPDHRAVTRIVEDARFDAKLTKLSVPGDGGRAPVYPRWMFYYFATHLRWVANPSFLIDATGYEAVKRAAVLAYESQFVRNPRNAGVMDSLEAGMRYFGSRIGTANAEGFFVKEPVGLSGLGELVM